MATPTTCTSLVAADPPNYRNAVRHWQAKHRHLPLRTLVFAFKDSNTFLELNDIYNTACTCAWAPACHVVAYTQLAQEGADDDDILADQVAAIGRFFAAHAQKAHGVGSISAVSSAAASKLYVRQACSEFLANSNDSLSSDNHAQEEIILDGSLEKKQKKKPVKKREKLSEPDQRRVSLSSLATEVNATTPLDNSVRGYKCAIGTCNKIFMVSSIQGPSVAISRLKNHFNNKHLDLGSDSFAFETIHSLEDLTSTGEGSSPAFSTPPRRKSPAKTAAINSPSASGWGDLSASPGDSDSSRDLLQIWPLL